MTKKTVIFLVLIVVAVVAAWVIYTIVKNQNREVGEPAPMEFEVVREWIPRDVGIGLEIVVDESTTKDMVVELGEYFRRTYAKELFVFIAIFDNEEAAKNRNTLSYPEEELMSHYLVQLTVNKNAGENELKWWDNDAGEWEIIE